MQVTQLNLKPGEIIKIGAHYYGKCGICGRVIRVNRVLTGSLHICR